MIALEDFEPLKTETFIKYRCHRFSSKLLFD